MGAFPLALAKVTDDVHLMKVRCPSSHTSETGTVRTFLVLRGRPSAAMAAAMPCRIGTRKP
jgi:hypothetical protein